jgi:NADH dehydrogenase
VRASRGKARVLPRVVIVGGGFGGLNAARGLARAPVDVTLIDRRNHHLFQPLLYQVATAALSPGNIASPIRWILRRQRNVRVLLGEAHRIDVERRVVVTDIGDIPYDFLIVASGSRHAYFGHDEWQVHAPGLKDLDDALGIRREILLAFENAERASDPAMRQRLLTFVIVGGGPTGVELAGALAEIARHSLRHDFRAIDPSTARIVLIEAGASVLPAFPEDLRAAALASLQKLGVEVRLNTAVTGVGGGSVSMAAEQLEASVILWAAGVAASKLGRTLGVPVDRAGRVLVARDLTIPDHPEVAVIGDLASLADDHGRLLPGVAPVAIQEGRHAAANIKRAVEGLPLEPFRYHNLGDMATIGRAAAVADLKQIRLTGWMAWLAWLFIHLVQLIGFRNRLLVLIQWASAYFTYQRSVRLITQDTTKGSPTHIRSGGPG